MKKMRYFCIVINFYVVKMAEMRTKPYKIGIALSGGGARGFAHAGALCALEEFGIKPNIIAGVSAGAIVGVMYSSGISPKNIPHLFDGLKFNDLCELGVPKDGFFKMDKFRRFLKKNLLCDNIEELIIPTFVCATDIEKGIPHAFSSGSIAERVAASCSIPIVFKPIRIDGAYYVDGGVLHNLPAWILRDKCELLIGLNCSPLIKEKYSPTILGIAERSFDLMSRVNAGVDMELCDIVIEMTDIANYRVFNLKDSNKVYNSGYNATKKILSGIDILEKYKTI